MSKTVLDQIDQQIIAALAKDGRMSFREIARQLDVSEGTVRVRMGRLQDENLIRVTLVGSPLALGSGYPQ
jgi:Lrp/AsnC family transcriptional regulator for asnA, asnC and gidA